MQKKKKKSGKIVLNGLIFNYKKSLLLKYKSYEGKDPIYLMHCCLYFGKVPSTQ